MFDVGFTELILLFVIGLLILGPERLPRVAAQLGRWMGKARRTAHQLRMQLEREMTMNDIMRNQDEREQKSESEQKSDSSQATAEKTEERAYPDDEDANDSGHQDADTDDADVSAESAANDGPANDSDAAQQRSA
jgi:sec-independent protein translocase protein TatB